MLPLILLLGLVYFTMIRPQQMQQRKRQEMLSSLKRGDNVVTIGGIHGTIATIGENTVRLQVGNNVEIEMSKTSIAYIKKEEES
ncbi:MAG TPA: preprotein translocase subunit YajC [Sphingobacteriaceae bacterium]|nr:preprotein translocase subunit YajC [Sphingobacteriaceae bacterium]